MQSNSVRQRIDADLVDLVIHQLSCRTVVHRHQRLIEPVNLFACLITSIPTVACVGA
jgi:hypothetical protein